MAEQPAETEEPIDEKSTPNASNRDGLRSRLDRLRLPYLLDHYPTRVVWAAFLLVNGFLTIGVRVLRGHPEHAGALRGGRPQDRAGILRLPHRVVRGVAAGRVRPQTPNQALQGTGGVTPICGSIIPPPAPELGR